MHACSCFSPEPSSGPTNVEFPRVTSSSILVTWSQPAKEDRNGVIRHYGVCFQSFFNYKPCINDTITTHASFELSGLKPHQAMKFAIKAATIVGYGPPTVRGISTHQDGMKNVISQVLCGRLGASFSKLGPVVRSPFSVNGE